MPSGQTSSLWPQRAPSQARPSSITAATRARAPHGCRRGAHCKRWTAAQWTRMRQCHNFSGALRRRGRRAGHAGARRTRDRGGARGGRHPCLEPICSTSHRLRRRLAHRALGEKKKFCHHTKHDVCQVQDSCGFQGARATKSGIGSLQREPIPTAVPSVSRRKCVWNLLHVVMFLTAFSARSFCPQADPSKTRAAAARQAVGLELHTDSLACLLSMMNFHAFVVQQRRAAARLPSVTVKTHSSLRLSRHRASEQWEPR